MTHTLRMPAAQSLFEVKQKLLAEYLRSQAATKAASSTRVTPHVGAEPARLSLSQEQLILRETGTPGMPPLYNECITLRMAGPLDVSILERSLHEIICRHETWRTSYDLRDGQPVQIIHPGPAEFSLPVLDIRDIEHASQEREIERMVGELVTRRFDLQRGPLIRAQLIRLDNLEHRLYLIAHLSVVDGVSVYQIFPQELATLYRAYSSGQPSPLAALPVRFADYACWQRQAAEGEPLEKQLAYWRNQLKGELPTLNWPRDRQRPARQTFAGKIQPSTLSKKLADDVKQLSRREGVTLFMTLLASFVTLLHCYTQQEEIIVGTPGPGGRKRSEVQNLLGYFLTPVALRFELRSNLTFRELLRQAQRLTLEAISNDELPVEVLAQRLNLKQHPSRTPLFSVAISLQPPVPQLDMDWTVTSMDIDSGGSPWELYIAFIDQPGRMMARVQYNPDLFYSETIHCMWNDFEQLLHRVTVDPLTRLSDFKCDR
ncbi:MAG TPA: condensation domain-containing protein [Terriglobales bacterium]|nr:condensation domain-containing protein [Terriglobales bacterium]